MSFNYEDIKDEVYLKMAKAACGMDYVWVTPKEFPPNYPLKKSSLESICLSSRYSIVFEA